MNPLSHRPHSGIWEPPESESEKLRQSPALGGNYVLCDADGDIPTGKRYETRSGTLFRLGHRDLWDDLSPPPLPRESRMSGHKTKRECPSFLQRTQESRLRSHHRDHRRTRFHDQIHHPHAHPRSSRTHILLQARTCWILRIFLSLRWSIYQSGTLDPAQCQLSERRCEFPPHGNLSFDRNCDYIICRCLLET